MGLEWDLQKCHCYIQTHCLLRLLNLSNSEINTLPCISERGGGGTPYCFDPDWSGVASTCNRGLWFQRLRLGHGSESWILDTRPEVRDKALALWLGRNELPQRQEVVKQRFIRRKKYTVYVDRHRGGFRERESGPSGSLNHFYETFLPLADLWPVILICLVQNPY